MPEGPWLYPEDEVSDATDRMIAAELTREQIVNQLHQELPYATAVETETWEDRPDGSTVIRQQILVARDSQKAIVIGKGGARLKRIGEAAREAIMRSTSAGRCTSTSTSRSTRSGTRTAPSIARSGWSGRSEGLASRRPISAPALPRGRPGSHRTTCCPRLGSRFISSVCAPQ